MIIFSKKSQKESQFREREIEEEGRGKEESKLSRIDVNKEAY